MTADQIIIDATIRDFLPPLSAEQVAGLERDILTDGRILKPLVTWKGRGILVDGHHRHTIAEKHGLPFEVYEIEFETLPDVMNWMLRHQDHQRQWNAYQRSETALKLKAAVAEAATARELAGKADPSPNSDEGPNQRRTDAVVAKSAGVGRTTLNAVETIKATAVPELQKMAAASAVTVDAAAKVATLPADEQRQVVAGGASAVKKKAAELRTQTKKKPAGTSRTSQPNASSTVAEPTDTAPPPPNSAPVSPEEVQPKRLKDFLAAKRIAVDVDQLGQKLPQDGAVRAAFEEAAELDHLVRLVGAIGTHVPRMVHVTARFKSHQDFEPAIRNVKRVLAAGRPHCVCPECKGTGTFAGHGCQVCHGLKWLAEWEFQMLPSELKEARL